jgi:alanyl-tRNA synthetase
MNADEIRSRFIGYFERNGHVHLASGPLVPADDPTLMFANAGMVQFKRVFVGERERPASRAVTAQKCLRVSGKHNDLEEVGSTARHHTFFEMLGNFSFGDYFKAEAIAYAWEFITEELGLEPDRLWATVHHSDDEAHRLWTDLTPIPRERVKRLGDKDNFWQMGDTGPCGPCSEVHYDLRPEPGGTLTDEELLAAGEADQFMEIWNLVFMQFDRAADGTDTPLPAPSIDTGAGLERIAAILQGTRTNYHTDLFLPLIAKAENLLGVEYPFEPERWAEGLPFRVLADHARAVAFLLADGVFPSNEKRGYVLRRILRRAVRYYWLLGHRDPLLHSLVETVADGMSTTYPELDARREHLVSTTRAEEERFLSTIDEAMARFDQLAPEGGSGVIPGREVFKLSDTYGVPLDLTQLMAGERGYDVDVQGFEEALEEQRARSREAMGSSHGGHTKADDQLASSLYSPDGAYEFVGYESLEAATRPLAHVATEGEHAFLLERNPFYAESGGQVSDTGWIRGDGWELRVDRVFKNDAGQTIVAGPVTSGLIPEDPGEIEARVDESSRRETERNHTATHLLHASLRSILGEHVHQAGSLVAPDRLRFDFSHRGPLTEGEREAVEKNVNDAILANHDVRIEERAYTEAIEAGAMALFGEKYGDIVRTIVVPGVSLELCGGTHVRTTGQIGLFKIVSETGVAAGIRRIEAITGLEAYRWVVERDHLVMDLARQLRVPDHELTHRVERLLEERERLERDASSRRGEAAVDVVDALLAAAAREGSRFVSGRVELPGGTDLGEFGDLIRSRFDSGAAVLHVVLPEDGGQAFVSVVTDDLIRSGLKAGDLVRISSTTTGSGGGGRPHFAQGGVGDEARVEEGLEKAREWAVEKVPELAT